MTSSVPGLLCVCSTNRLTSWRDSTLPVLCNNVCWQVRRISALLQAADPVEGPVWPSGLRHRLPDAPTHSILAQQGPVHAVGLAQTSEGCLAYCLGHTGTLKIFNAVSGSQVRGWPFLGQAHEADIRHWAPARLELAVHRVGCLCRCGQQSSRICPARPWRSSHMLQAAHRASRSCCAAPMTIRWSLLYILGPYILLFHSWKDTSLFTFHPSVRRKLAA